VRERTMLERSTERVSATLAQDLRFGLIVVWTGRMLLGLGLFAILLGSLWLAVDMVFLAGAYGLCGCLMWIAGSRSTAGFQH
jgi:hypothetical protein